MTIVNELVKDTISEFNKVDNISLDYIKDVAKNPFKTPYTSTLKINRKDSNKYFNLAQSENHPEGTRLIEGCMCDMSLYTSLQLQDFTIDLKCRFEGINVDEGYILIPVLTNDANPATIATEAINNKLPLEAAYKSFLAQRVFKKSFTVYYLFIELLSDKKTAFYKVAANMRLKGEKELIETLPACYILKNSEQELNYSDLCPNENGIFELDI